MKFPAKERLVPHLSLSDDECEHYDKMAHALVDDMLAQYIEYNEVYLRQVNREQWREVKRRCGLRVYKERKVVRPKVMRELQTSPATQRTARNTCSNESTRPFASTSKWVVPTLLMVGSIVGTLDDVMYGVATFDAPSMLLKTTYTEDELVDGEVLSQIAGPSRDDPFRFLGLKWIVKGNPPGMSKLVRPRDLVFLEATGIHTDAKGERYGYHLMHSLDLPGFGPLRAKTGILRGRVSSCIVFKQHDDSGATVDVFMKANFDPNGSVGETVAVLSAANGLIYCGRAVHCAQHKKLAWMLTQSHQQQQSQEPAGTTAAVDLQTVGACRTCGKVARAFRQLTPCVLCCSAVCSRCRVTKKINYVASSDRQSKTIHQRVLPFCTRCIAQATQASALAIARDEVSAGKWDGGRDNCAANDLSAAAVFARWQSHDVALSASSFSDSMLSSARDNEWSQQPRNYRLDPSRACSTRHSHCDATSSTARSPPHRLAYSNVSAVSSARSSSVFDSDDDANVASTRSAWSRTPSHVRLPESDETAAPSLSSVDAQAQLYQRIAELRNTAESIYHIAMTNAVAMQAATATTTTATESDAAPLVALQSSTPSPS